MSAKILYTLARPLLFTLPAETAHNLTLPALRGAAQRGLAGAFRKPEPDPRTVMGITFPNPVGLAAGLDKDGAYIDGLAALGFGSIEIGTVTPRPQAGNPKPRMFRIPAAQGIINRMGFNNRGVDAFVANVQASRFYQEKRGVLGLNIGKNADTPIERAADDYLECLRKVYPYASYVTVNISSPNTKNLRQLQGASELDSLLSQLKAEQTRLADQHGRYVPLALKIAPDIDADQIRDIAGALLRHKIDGVIATNTTLNRRDVERHRAWHGNRRRLGRTGIRPVEHRDPRHEEATGRRDPDHRRRRHPVGEGRAGKNRGRRPAGAALQRPDLPRPFARARMRRRPAHIRTTRMQRTRLGRSTLEVSKVCLGTMTFGEQNTESDAHRQLDYALERGINFIDTAEMYPVMGRAETQGATERFIGSWLKARGRRDDLVIASKIAGPNASMGWIRGPAHNLDAANIRAAVETSLQRLQTDYIDLYQIHWPSRNLPIFGANSFNPKRERSSVPIEETLGALGELVKAGKIREIGVSNESSGACAST